MPRTPYPCPACKGALSVTDSGELYTDDRTGLLMRIFAVRCLACGRKGKGIMTADIDMLDDDDTPPIGQDALSLAS